MYSDKHIIPIFEYLLPMGVKGKHLAMIAIGIVIIAVVIPGQPFQLTVAACYRKSIIGSDYGGVQ